MHFPSKELFIAVIIGFAVGLIVTYGVWRANQAIRLKQQSLAPIPTESIPALEKSPLPPEENNSHDKFKLNVAQPEVHTLTELDTIHVSGTTQPLTNVIIYGENDYQIVVANKQGEFNAEQKLVKGINFLTVTATTDTGEQLTVNRTVIQSTAEFE